MQKLKNGLWILANDSISVDTTLSPADTILAVYFFLGRVIIAGTDYWIWLQHIIKIFDV